MLTENTASPETIGVARRAVEDAVWAPSVHNTQPWRFGISGRRISLRADPDLRLDVADPDGREMLLEQRPTLRMHVVLMDADPLDAVSHDSLDHGRVLAGLLSPSSYHASRL